MRLERLLIATRKQEEAANHELEEEAAVKADASGFL
jgi:hypothetical protein